MPIETLWLLILCILILQVGIAFVDKDYPARAAFGIVTRVLDEFSDQSRDAWRTATADTSDAVPMLEAAVSKYQASAWCSRSMHATLWSHCGSVFERSMLSPWVLEIFACHPVYHWLYQCSQRQYNIGH